jgi:Fe-S-cluster containining protein
LSRDDAARDFRVSSLDIHFKCVQCAACCHRTKIPVTVTEAIDWLRDGHQVQVICEASPWIPADEAQASHLMRRSFAAASGSMRVRMVVTLVANINGACPNLLPDLRCGIYERRPLVCRIYPVETNPFIRLETAKKGCPPEAWSAEHPLLQREGRVVSEVIRDDVFRWREANVDDVRMKLKLCAALNIVDAAVAQEGFLIHSPPLAELLKALSVDSEESEGGADEAQWRLLSDRDDTLDHLAKAGADFSHPRDVSAVDFEYIGLKR